MHPESSERPAGEPGGAEPEARLAESIDRLFQGMQGGAGVPDAGDAVPGDEAVPPSRSWPSAPEAAPVVGAALEVEDSAAEREVEDSAAKREVEDSAAEREVEDSPAAREVEDSAAAREVEDTAAEREFEDFAAEPVPVGSAEGEPAETPTGDDAQDLAVELDRAVSAYLDRSAPERDEPADRIESLIGRMEAAQTTGGAAGALERLALADGGSVGEAEGDALALARRLLTPALARSLVERLGAEARDEAARERSVRALARLGEGMAGALAAALTDATERVERRAYLDALVALGDDALPFVEPMTSDPRWFVVRNSLLVLRELGGERALEHFTVALAHADPRVRREALLSLAHVGGESATLLVPSGLADPDREVRQAAAMAVGALRADRAVKSLLERLEQEDEADVQVEVLRALGQIGDPGAVLAIEKRAEGSLFSRPPTAVRVAAYRALWAIGTPHARKSVEAAASDRDAEVRDAVAQTMSASPTR